MIGKNKDLLDHFLSDLENQCALFIGYSLADMDIGSHLWAKRAEDRDIHWYAVFPSDSQTRRMYDQRMGVRVINRKFHEIMKELDEKVDFIPPQWKFDEIPNLRKEGLIG